ncbi:DNA fragmentation factor subunit beta isoform X1 [Hylaeus volcanicus]|uniref:DNA fragmentation factor subunit beta isoform X1 n=1 Tax=Hylaeus volcanicus TaxID=313075 RepID=UPI0023B77535|nr:DNA fragmentation factor subunit beta isoform X1 [Hylaeus volcanicus]
MACRASGYRSGPRTHPAHRHATVRTVVSLDGCFRRLTKVPERNEVEGFKVTDVNRTRKFGVACSTLPELKQKVCAKLNITNHIDEVNVFLLDGTLIDEEYFCTLEPQTTLIVQKPGEKVLSDADLLYDALRRVNIDFLAAGSKASEFLTENLKAKVAILNSALNKDDSKTALTARDEHPEWFRGLETNYTTKEAYMHRRCQDRIRGYLYKTIDQIKSSDTFANDHRARKRLLDVIAFFKMQLKEDHYFGYYFDRSRAKIHSTESVDERDSSTCYDHCPCRLNRLDDSTYFRLFGTSDQSCVDGTTRKKQERNSNVHSRSEDEESTDEQEEEKESTDEQEEEKESTGEQEEEEDSCPYRIRTKEWKSCVAICNPKGEFRCGGVWKADACVYGQRHKINPYRSREDLILFSTWNFDHKIERSRTLVPQLLELSAQGIAREEDIHEFYDDLFTLKNLRLVHIVCHDKGSHK